MMMSGTRRFPEWLIGIAVALAASAFAAIMDVRAAGDGSATGTATSNTGGSPSAGRTLRFPRNRSLGTLYVQETDAKREIDTFYHWIHGAEWEYFGEAQGDVSVPPQKRLWLAVGKDACEDLSTLSRLGPDGLYRLSFRYLAPGESDAAADDRCMRHLTHLTGLKTLYLYNTHVTHKGLRFIRGLRSLTQLPHVIGILRFFWA